MTLKSRTCFKILSRVACCVCFAAIYGASDLIAEQSEAILVKTSEPSYSDEARRANYKADVFLTVTVDKQGHPRNVRVFRPVSLGLDDKALQAVRLWEFRPATRNGIALSTQVLIEISFRPGQKTKSKIATEDDLPIEYGDH